MKATRDWNGDGKKDAFDSFIDYKMMEDLNKDEKTSPPKKNYDSSPPAPQSEKSIKSILIEAIFLIMAICGIIMLLVDMTG